MFIRIMRFQICVNGLKFGALGYLIKVTVLKNQPFLSEPHSLFWRMWNIIKAKNWLQNYISNRVSSSLWIHYDSEMSPFEGKSKRKIVNNGASQRYKKEQRWFMEAEWDQQCQITKILRTGFWTWFNTHGLWLCWCQLLWN